MTVSCKSLALLAFSASIFFSPSLEVVAGEAPPLPIGENGTAGSRLVTPMRPGVVAPADADGSPTAGDPGSSRAPAAAEAVLVGLGERTSTGAKVALVLMLRDARAGEIVVVEVKP